MEVIMNKTIDRWTDFLVTGELKGSCPLCVEFNKDGILDECKGCPVYIINGDPCCFYTPFETLTDHLYSEHADGDNEVQLKINCSECKEIVSMEIWFLQRVLEEYK